MIDKKIERKKFVSRLIIGSIIFSIIVFGKNIYVDGEWKLSGILWCIYGAVGYGGLYYLMSRFGIYKSLWEKGNDNK